VNPPGAVICAITALLFSVAVRLIAAALRIIIK
jgi:hypothetical protein